MVKMCTASLKKNLRMWKLKGQLDATDWFFFIANLTVRSTC